MKKIDNETNQVREDIKLLKSFGFNDTDVGRMLDLDPRKVGAINKENREAFEILSLDPNMSIESVGQEGLAFLSSVQHWFDSVMKEANVNFGARHRLGQIVQQRVDLVVKAIDDGDKHLTKSLPWHIVQHRNFGDDVIGQYVPLSSAEQAFHWMTLLTTSDKFGFREGGTRD